MKLHLSTLLIGLLFVGLLLGTGVVQTHLKKEPQLYMLLLGLLTLASFFVRLPFKTPVLFYILLATMLYTTIFLCTHLLLNAMSSNEGWVVSAENHRLMQSNYIVGLLSGLVLSPLILILYHKKAPRNKRLEISLTAIFSIITAIIYIKYEL